MAALPDVPRQLVYDSNAGVAETRAFREWLNALRKAVVAGSSGGGAPVDATYLTLSLNSVLTNERVLTAGTNISFVDTGANGTLTINAAGGGTASPLTTKGDVWGYSTVNARIPVGADGNVLTADSTQALGLKWAAPSSGAPVNAQYVTMALDGTLTSERVLTAGTDITITDGGANGPVTISVTNPPSLFNWGKFIAGTHCWPAG